VPPMRIRAPFLSFEVLFFVIKHLFWYRFGDILEIRIEICYYYYE